MNQVTTQEIKPVYFVGDKVMVTDWGSTYTSFSVMAEAFNLSNWDKSQSVPLNTPLTILGFKQNPVSFDKTIYSVETQEGLQYMTSSENFKLVEDKEDLSWFKVDEENNLVIFYNNREHFVEHSNENITKIFKYCQKGLFEQAFNLAKPVNAVTEFVQGDIQIKDNVVKHKSKVLKGDLIDDILKLMLTGSERFVRLVALLNKLKNNPSYKTRGYLYEFVKCKNIEITETGNLLFWKKINTNWTDTYTGTISNKPGQVVAMNRSEVNDDSEAVNTEGLHVYSRGIQKSVYPGKIVKVEVNPSDIVSLPNKNCVTGDVRVCEYLVVEEIT